MIEKAFPDLDLSVVIISRGRSKSITTHIVAPFAHLIVPESQISQYQYTGVPITPIPDNIEGLGAVRNWVLENVTSECVIMMDDDITKLWCNVGLAGYTITNPQDVYTVLEVAAQCAKDIGVATFGFNQTWDVRAYDASKPFSLNDMLGGVIGVIGRKRRFLSCNKFRVDVDYTLEGLKHERRIWRDNRYSFVQTRNTNIGGNAEFRTRRGVEREQELLKNKWGVYYQHQILPTAYEGKGGEKTTINVKRTQQIKGIV